MGVNRGVNTSYSEQHHINLSGSPSPAKRDRRGSPPPFTGSPVTPEDLIGTHRVLVPGTTILIPSGGARVLRPHLLAWGEGSLRTILSGYAQIITETRGDHKYWSILHDTGSYCLSNLAICSITGDRISIP